jgi:hypothetical protein
MGEACKMVDRDRKLQQAETPIDQAIVNELIALTPEWWKTALLEVTHSSEAGIEKMSHIISSPEGHRDIVTASDELFQATYNLATLFKKNGSIWKKATYRASIEKDGTWTYTVDFEY